LDFIDCSWFIIYKEKTIMQLICFNCKFYEGALRESKLIFDECFMFHKRISTTFSTRFNGAEVFCSTSSPRKSKWEHSWKKIRLYKLLTSSESSKHFTSLRSFFQPSRKNSTKGKKLIARKLTAETLSACHVAWQLEYII
jgi:hypothetical protein